MNSLMTALMLVQSGVIVFACTWLGWMMRQAGRPLRRWSGMVFFWSLGAMQLCLALSVINVEQGLYARGWQMTVVRGVIAVSAAALAFAVYIDLGGIRRRHPSPSGPEPR